jgi:hypothetical protein
MSGRPDPLDPVEVVDLIAEAARACPAVAGLHGGPFGRAAPDMLLRLVTAGGVPSAEET